MQSRTRTPLFGSLFAFFDGWRGTILALILSPILIGIALWLPPVSLGERIFDAGYTRLPDEGGSLTLADGAQLTIPADAVTSTPRVRFESLTRAALIDGTAQGAIAGAAAVLPTALSLKSDVYVAQAREPLPAYSVWNLAMPADTNPTLVDVYGWDGTRWFWMPHSIVNGRIESRANGLPLGVAVLEAQKLTPKITTVSDESIDFLNVRGPVVLSGISPRLYFLQGDGGIGQYFTLTPLFSQSGSPLFPVIRNVDPDGVVRSDLVDNLLVDPNRWNDHFSRIEALLNGSPYDGIVIDYRGINPVLRDAFVLYVESLSQRLQPQNFSVIVRVGDPIAIDADTFDTGAYDWTRLGAAASGIRVPVPPTFTYSEVRGLATLATEQIDRYKLTFDLIAAPTAQQNGLTIPVNFTDVAALVTTEEQPLLTSSDTDAPHRVTVQSVEVVLENKASIERRLAILAPFTLEGITLSEGAFADPTFWEAVAGYQSGQ